MKAVFRFFTERHLLANAMTVMIMLLGSASLLTINREEFPNASPGYLRISTSYSGASPEDVELNITNPLEDALKGVTGIKHITSTSAENSSSIGIEIDEDVDQEETYDEIVDAVNSVNNLPEDAGDPRIRKFDPRKKSIMRFGLSSDALSYAELRDYVHQLEKLLLEVPGVAEVGLSGYRSREVRIEVSPDKMMQHGISLNEISQAISAYNIRAAGGSLEAAGGEKNVITLSQFTDPLEVGDVIVRSYASGAVVHVKDVATVEDTFEEEDRITRINGKPAISLSVTKNANADLVSTADAVNAVLAEEQAALPAGLIDFLITDDDSEAVRDKFEIVKTNGAIGLVFVLLVLALFLNLRTSFWVAMGIPISLLGVLMCLPFFDVELDSLTMSAMVLVIGIIVDDAIVIAENIFQHRERGEPALAAAVNGLHEVAMPVFTTIVTTILAFLPMFFIKGMLGKFIYVVPLTVILSLSMSLLESYFILPAHLLPGLRGPEHRQVGRRWFYPVRERFERLLAQMLQLRYVWVFTACLILAASLLYASSSIKFKLFARGKNIDTVDLTLRMPLGTDLDTTSAKMQEVEDLMADFPKNEIAGYMSRIGSGGFRGASGPHLGTLTLYFPPTSELGRPVNAIIQNVRAAISQIQGVESLSLGMSMRGPPTGRAIEIMVKGADKPTRNAAISAIMTFLNGIDGVSDLERDDKAGKTEIVIQPKASLLARYGLTVSDIAQTIRTANEGQVATTTRYGDEDVDFRVGLADEHRRGVAFLKHLKVTNKQGELINLEEVATFTERTGVYALYHEEGEPTITLTGEVDETLITPLEVMAAVQQEFDFDKLREYPGVRLDIGGEAADSQQAITDILTSFALAAVGIYFLLMLLFNSLTQPLIVLATIPFGVAGVIFALALHGITQTTFFAGIGVVGLAGVVVNDALVLVDHLNGLKRRHTTPSTPLRVTTELIAQGAADRLRPVLLTTVTTVAGLLPLTYGVGGEDAMMAPMAMALGYGLLFATPITLILLPCLYMIQLDVQAVAARLANVARREKTLDEPQGAPEELWQAE